LLSRQNKAVFQIRQRRIATLDGSDGYVARLTDPRADYSRDLLSIIGIIGIIENLLVSASCFGTTNRSTASLVINYLSRSIP
jgi:hypothetical protein